MLKSCQHGMTDTSRPRSLSLLLGLRQLQGLLLRQRSHCQVPGTSALRWAFHRLKRKSRFPSRLPMRHVSRASMASTIKSEWHNAGTLEDSASNASSQGPSFVGYGSQSPEPEFTGAGACLVESAFGFEAPNEEKIEEAQEITVNWSELAHSNGLVSTQAPTSQRSSSSMQVSELVSWMPAQAAPMGTMASAVGTRAKYTEAPLAIGMGTRSNFAEAAPMGTMASAVGTRANYTEAPLAIGMGTRSNFAEAAPMGTMASAAVPLETTAGSQANYEVAPMRTMAACVGTDMQAMDFGIGCQVQMDAEVFAPALGTLGQAQMARPINQGATVDIVCCSTEGQVSVPVPAVRSSYSAPVRASVSSTVSPPRAFAKDLHPEAFHSAEEIDTIVRRIIQEVLGDAKVSHRPELSDLWCDQILERVLKEVSSLGRPFKYMATCVISKQPGSLDTARQWAEEKTTRARRTKIDGRPPKEGGVEGAVSPTPTATIVTVSLDPDLDLAAPETRADEEDLVVAMARAKVVEKVELEVTFQPPDLGALQEMAPLPTTTFIICLLIERKREWFGILLRQTRSETCCEIKALKSLKGKDAGNTRTDGKVLGPMRMPRSGRWRRKIEVHDFGPAISSPAYFSALEDLSGRTWTNGLLLLPFGIRSMIVCVAAVWAMVAWTALSLSTPAGVSDQFRLRPTAVEL
eukprot:symbB.v1.2.017732.t1/scaffold1366.1/size123243/8